jgi:hypothetical protein
MQQTFALPRDGCWQRDDARLPHIFQAFVEEMLRHFG